MQKKISNFQLLIIVFFIITGTSAMYGVGNEAKQDAWMVSLLSMLIFLIPLSIYIYISNQYPKMRFTEIIEHVLGKWIGKLIILMYSLYFIYISSRNLADITHFSHIYLLDDTPSIAIIIFVAFVSSIGLFVGINIIIKSSKYVFYIVITLYLIVITVIIVNNFSVQNKLLTNLTPILENGWEPILKSMSVTLTFPFGELIVVLMIIHLLDSEKHGKIFLRSVVISGTFLAFIIMFSIIITGPNVYVQNYFKLLPIIEEIKLALLERLDSLITVLVIIGAFYKHLILLYGGVVALQDFFSLAYEKVLIIPVIIVVILGANLMSMDNMLDLIFGLKVVPYYIHYPMQFGIPIILFIIIIIKKNFIKNKIIR